MPANVNDLIKHLTAKQFDLAERDLAGGVNVNAVDANGTPVLSLMVADTNVDAVTFLLKHKGIDVNKKDAVGDTPRDAVEKNIDFYNVPPDDVSATAEHTKNCVTMREALKKQGGLRAEELATGGKPWKERHEGEVDLAETARRLQKNHLRMKNIPAVQQFIESNGGTFKAVDADHYDIGVGTQHFTVPVDGKKSPAQGK